MIMSAEPQLKAEDLAKRILNFAKFDHVAIKVEQKFKQASLVRARAAIMMMSRTINILRHQMMRMIFTAWKGNNAIQTRHDAIMHRLIKIKDIQLKSHSKELEMEQLKDNLKEARRLVFTATNAMLELLQQSLRSADNDVLRFLQLKQMYPNTIGRFTEAVNGQKILDALSSGSIAAADGDTSTDDVSADEMMAKCAANTKAQIDQMAPHDNLIQWLNFQGRRGTDMAYEAAQITPVGAAQANAIRLKPKVKEKKKEYREIKGLQDLRAMISSPGAMLKLLCHASEDARVEYDRFRATETSSNTSTAAAENSTMTTTLSPSALLQLKAYFKIVGRNLNLPPDVITRDAFVLGDFNSLYAYAVYLYTFHPNYIAPGLALSPRHHLSYEFLTPQWEKIQRVLTENMCDPFAQQQLYIFIAKIKRVNKHFLRFEQVCHYVDEIAQWHQQSALRETFNDFTRRVLGKDSTISVALERETLASWVSLSPAKLLNLCANEDELKDIEKVFKDNVLDLVKIFRIYGSGAGGKGILEQEFLKVMTRAGVTDKKNILRSHLQIIYQQARQSSPTPTPTSSPASNSSTSPAGGSGSDGEDDAGADDRGATPNEFFEALVRVAHHNFQKRRDPGGFVNPLVAGTLGVGIGATLLLHVIELVVDKIVPLTKKSQEQGLMFKKQMVHPDVQYVCKTQEKKLKRVFVAYSQKNKNPNSRGKLMDLNDFETLLKDRRLVDALFPYGKVKQLVSFVQQDGDLSAMGGGGYDSDTEFVFTEFLEALAAIAVFRNANPYLPLAKKLEMFFDEYF
ncbi:hypothetical protein Poli38472_005300 [Pythium oligandrum]|uniref:Uncharacterized protein n=1 Tax=Pythium oligandrum TaxID=41045 RepID=A0A8K1CIC9_PYTOL|nr:hypothetical protein Poli38472_005300 [Pythium oligandrum]|eukprot:TMW62682.1 hypothetical protein Poli38472_005300 [Pythium oligandrum]